MAARRSLPILLSEGVHAKGLCLPDQMDPDDFLKAKGPEELKMLMSNAPDLFIFLSLSLILSLFVLVFFKHTKREAAAFQLTSSAIFILMFIGFHFIASPLVGEYPLVLIRYYVIVLPFILFIVFFMLFMTTRV